MDVKVLLGCFSLFVASAVYADSCPQETSYTVDARQNCLGAPWGSLTVHLPNFSFLQVNISFTWALTT